MCRMCDGRWERFKKTMYWRWICWNSEGQMAPEFQDLSRLEKQDSIIVWWHTILYNTYMNLKWRLHCYCWYLSDPIGYIKGEENV